MTGAISIVNPLIFSNWFASDLWRKWKHVRRREILLTDDVRAWIPPGDPHGQRNPPKLEGPERSQSGNEERGDADSTKKAHNTNLAWERAAHLQGFLRNNSLYCLLIWWRFLHVFRFSLSLFFFFSVFEGFSENRFLETHSEAFISTLTYQLLSIYNHMKARKPASGISSFLSFIFYFSGDDDQRTRNYGPSTTWTEEWKFKGCQLQPSSERVQMHSFKLRTAFIFLQLQKINEILHHVSVSRTKKRTTYGWLLKNIIIR